MQEKVLGLLLEGLPRTKIALRLGKSPGTVNSHRERLLKKFGVNSTLALMQRVTLLDLS
jgi:DNA-binding CsgD family transcriptional regulator